MTAGYAEHQPSAANISTDTLLEMDNMSQLDI